MGPMDPTPRQLLVQLFAIRRLDLKKCTRDFVGSGSPVCPTTHTILVPPPELSSIWYSIETNPRSLCIVNRSTDKRKLAIHDTSCIVRGSPEAL